MIPRLTGVTALVTGAAGGMGVAITARLLAEGASVAFADLDGGAADAAALAHEAQYPGRVSGHRVDVRSDDSAEALVAAVVESWGGLDLLVNNAGIMARQPALGTDTALFQSILDVNLTGSYRMARAAHDALAASSRANIVSISSTHAFLAAKNSIAYSTSKAGLSHLTRLLALEWADEKIRVNAVAPTVVPSAMTADVLADPDYVARKFTAIPLGRAIPAAHVAAAVAYLASDDAASTTGQILVIDGGESLA